MPSTPAKRVLFFLSAGWGPVVRTLPIVRRLADNGVAGALAIDGAIGPKIRAAGFDLIALDRPARTAIPDAACWSPYHLLARCNADVAPLLAEVNACRKAISAANAAAVVTDINPIAALAARSLQVPHVSVSQSLFLPYRERQSERWALPDALPAINTVLAQHGVALLDCVAQLDVGDVTLVPSIPEFDPMQDVPSSLRYIGPILGNDLVPLPLLARRPPSSHERPHVFLYPGRPHDGAGSSGQTLLTVALRALSGLDVRVTVATGGYDFDISGFSGSEIEIVPWRLIADGDKPDLMLHHGGHGACLTAIGAGIPSVIIPTHAEREYNATNLVAMGCGELVAMEQTDALPLRAAIETVLGNGSYGRACRHWGETIAARQYAGADVAARSIMQRLGF